MGIVWLAFLAGIGYLASFQTDDVTHIAMSATIMACLLVIMYLRDNTTARIIGITLGSFITMKYLVWRISNTMPDLWTLEFFLGVALLMAELYGVFIFLSGTFVSIMPMKRKVASLPADRDQWPTVDVIVPTYNEPWEVLGVTLMACVQIRYPKDRFRVICCDDGGTEQKRTTGNASSMADALERHEFLKAKCAEIGVDYITRPKNNHAKAGNINEALVNADCTGDLVLILDADHAPTEDILEKTVGQFLKDDRLFLCQTPHFFITPDPLEKNLKTYGHMPAENDMFYQHMQLGLDYWNASFFCGSAAVLRRLPGSLVMSPWGPPTTNDVWTKSGKRLCSLTPTAGFRWRIGGTRSSTDAGGLACAAISTQCMTL